MKTLKTLILLALISNTSLIVHGQNKIQGYILDKKTSEPLSYATIGALHQQYGTYSDSSGLYTLYFLNERDSLKVSYLGYRSIFTTVRDLKSSTKIFLEAKPVQIKEVVISSKKIKSKKMELGYFSKKAGPAIIIYSTNTYATFIPFPQNTENIVIKAVKFKYKLASKNSALRIRVLKVMHNGEPGEDMIEDNIIFNNYKPGQNETAIIDISGYNIIMPHNGIFIGLEWIDTERIPKLQNTKPDTNGPRIGTIKIGDSSKSNWVNNYNFPKWHKSSLPFTFAIGLMVNKY